MTAYIRLISAQSGLRHLHNLAALLLLASLPVFAQENRGKTQDGMHLQDCDSAQSARVLMPAIVRSTDARAIWLSRDVILWPGADAAAHYVLHASPDATLKVKLGEPVRGARLSIPLTLAEVPTVVAPKYGYLKSGPQWKLELKEKALRELMRGQLLLTKQDAKGKVIDYTGIQIAGSLDDLYARVAEQSQLGVFIQQSGTAIQTQLALWAPTAQQVAVCMYDTSDGKATSIASMHMQPDSGVWSAQFPRDLSNHYYRYLVDVMVPGLGLLRNRVTDPYSVSLNSDSLRSYIANLNSAALKPQGWDQHIVPATVRHPTDMSIYELHVRDFSANDASVPAAHRGKYLAFTDTGSRGMQHLQALAAAGMTDIHLLPVFDFATVPESTCVTPEIPSLPANSNIQQAISTRFASTDCFNWGYDPLHYNAPEGSYASDPADGARRIIEFRSMVQALHAANLRVGMDVVYNHTAFSGQHAQSALDRIVPNYYHRLNAAGKIEDSTCQPCGNTATENRMMAKLVSDSVRLWAREYKIDSFRFDLMGHQPRALMERLRDNLEKDNGRPIYLIGEGWNFGEVANNARFVQASQLMLNGSHIGTFSDRARDALRGGGFGDTAESMMQNQGYINGLIDRPNAAIKVPKSRTDMLKTADLVRVGLAGSLRNYAMQTADGPVRKLADIDYNGQPAGYASAPDEVVNYVENHDNQTLFDINAYRLPTDTSHEDRNRVQILGLALTAFSQGIAYFHAGSDILRSKSMDGNSYDSGDWFNRIDWSYQDNGFGSGLPPAKDNARYYPLLNTLLTNPQIKPRPQDIEQTRQAFLDVLKIRRSSSLFHLTDAKQIQQRLQFFNTGPQQNPALIAFLLDGSGIDDESYRSILVLINVASTTQELIIQTQKNQHYQLHPVHMNSKGGDIRIARQAAYIASEGKFILPERSVVVFVEENKP